MRNPILWARLLNLAETVVQSVEREGARVPWADHDARFTRAFDEQVACLVVHCAKSAVGELMRVS